ncbi:MAG: hypothetical protein ACTTKH_01550 [Treponema sp.]
MKLFFVTDIFSVISLSVLKLRRIKSFNSFSVSSYLNMMEFFSKMFLQIA